MKKIYSKILMGFIFFVLAIISKNPVSAQGNLQFNQVILVSSIQTVPANKVWKIENASLSITTNITFSLTDQISSGDGKRMASFTYLINGTTNYGGMGTTNSSFNSPPDHVFPFWLPAGTTLAAGTNVNYLSVIEFNIIQ
jgi:hypothetical protein